MDDTVANSASMETCSSDLIFLHGNLKLEIVKARNLPNMDLFIYHLRRFVSFFDTCRNQPTNGNRNHHKSHRKIITSDPYVVVVVGGAKVAHTKVKRNDENPVWNQEFNIPLAHPVSEVEFLVKDNDMFGAQLIGNVLINARRILSGESIDDWFPINGPNGTPPKRDTALYLKMKFTPVESNPLYQHSIAADPEHLGVRNTYFPVRRGCSVTLYQDAHVRPGDLPYIKLDNGTVFEHEKCWEDICHAILEAHHLIYIVGWSIYHQVKLVREPTPGRQLPNAGKLTLGDLLKYKSQEGVRVLMLVWNDVTSLSNSFIKTTGVMQPHDEETREFFKHSSVICVLSPRYGSSKLSIVKQKVVGTLFSHHQKCVLVDTYASGNCRKITAFLGGLDLCGGRYDTPEHRLFDTVFQDDFYNPTLPAGAKGPRQPWHDLHSRIEGPAAYDVLENFEQRWRKARKWTEFRQCWKKISHRHDDALIAIERISWILSPSNVTYGHPSPWFSDEQHPETWHVQVFRSIDSGSVRFPEDVHENLVCDKNVLVDRSIQTGYIQAIRSAQHFIYIENQYFLGSCYAWPSHKSAGAFNLIPMELALKIASKIRAKERFAVYIVIPMWPEGDPSSASVQEILFWQSQTMQMMYEIIARQLKDMHLEHSHPRDYLNFYCLGNREPDGISHLSSQPSTNDDAESAAQKNRRFMIYVHAKGMVVDDEYVIVGSSNINDRSLDGSRDTEIAMGAYQPHHTWTKERHPHGQVQGYRMSLWAEHMGMVNELFEEPHRLDCVEYVNKLASQNWEAYVAEKFEPLFGHLLQYPISVEANGKVSTLPGHENFPDVGGQILGTPSSIPDALTT